MGETVLKFVDLVKEGGTILDLGCGSGRDSKTFLERGFEVTAMDASSEMCELASIHTGLEVLNIDMRQMEFDQVFDGIWACASLLHVTPDELGDMFGRIERALTPGGIFYMSVKTGSEQGFRNKRYFADYEIQDLICMCNEKSNLSIVETWHTEDVRADRTGDSGWSNLLARKKSS